MVELLGLAVVALAIVGVVLGIGSRDRIRTLEFRLALIQRRLRAGAACPAGNEPPAPLTQPPGRAPPPSATGAPACPSCTPGPRAIRRCKRADNATASSSALAAFTAAVGGPEHAKSHRSKSCRSESCGSKSRRALRHPMDH